MLVDICGIFFILLSKKHILITYHNFGNGNLGQLYNIRPWST